MTIENGWPARLGAIACSGIIITPAVGQDAMTLPPTVVIGESVDGLVSPWTDTSGQAELGLFQAESLEDLSGLVPNLFFTSSDTRGFGDNVSYRGQGNTLFFGPPSVAVYVDDVPFGDAFTYTSELLAVEEVDFHRGPQGPNFGRNGAAGVIDMRTVAPGDEQRFTVGGEYGSYDSVGLRLGSSGPLGGDFSHSLRVYYRERDGYVNNVFLNEHTDDRESMGVLANLYWQPCDEAEWRLRFLAESTDDGSQRLTSLFSPDPYTVASNVAGETVIDRYQLSLHGRQDFAWGTLKSVTSWQYWELDPSVVDLDLTPDPTLESSSSIIQDQTYLTQELRFESPPDAGPWRWRGGLFFSDKRTDGDATRNFPSPFGPFSERTLFGIDEQVLAGFGSVALDATDQLTLDLGLRVEYVESEISRSKNTTFGPAPSFNLSQDDWYASPVVGAEFALNELTTLHARSGIGVKPAGYTAYSDTVTGAAFGEETSWSNELGMRIACPDGSLDFGFRGFWNQVDDYQLNQSVPGSTDFIVVNADEVSVVGLEADLRWRPVDALELLFTAGWQDAEFDSYTSPFSGLVLDGRSVPYVPEFTASGGFRYRFANGFFVGSTLRAVGETFYDELNTAAFRQGSYLVWDAQVGWASETLTVALFGRNLADQEYYTFINDQVFAGTPGDPQIIGVKVDARF